MKIYIVFLDNPDDYYSRPGYCGAFATRAAAEKFIEQKMEKEREVWEHFPAGHFFKSKDGNYILNPESWDIFEDELI